MTRPESWIADATHAELTEQLATCRQRYQAYLMMPLGMNVVPDMERISWQQRLIYEELERRQRAK